MATKTPEMVAEVTNKSDLLARLQAYEAQQAIMKGGICHYRFDFGDPYSRYTYSQLP
jgi:hypothetical protein